MAILAVEKGLNKGAQYKLPREGEILLGRSSVCQLPIADSKASRQHCRVEVAGGRMTVADLDSHNGTLVNGEKIVMPTEVEVNDTIAIGDVIVRIRDDASGTLIGKELSGYHLEQRLGQGGMGDVYRATQASLGRTVAVKVLSEELALDRAFVERFLNEARAAGRLSHANVVHVHEVGQDKGRYFYAMEYVAGGNVHQLVEGGGTLDPKQAVKMIVQTAKALDYAEKEGIVHCDIKPENLMVTAEGDIRLADLGIAKKTGEVPLSDDGEGVFGSPHYMSPEQSRGEPVDNRSDLYSLGCTFYRLLSGKVPFDGKTGREIMEKQVYEEATPIRKISPSTPGVVSVIVSKLLQKKPADRYQTAGALIKDLEHARQVIGEKSGPLAQRVTGRQVRVRGPKGHTLTVIFGIGAVLAAVVGVLMVVSHLNEPLEIYEQALALERAGKLEAALKLYKEVDYKAGGSDVGAKARERIAAVKERMDLGKRTEAFKEDVARIKADDYANGEELAAGLGRLRRLAREKHLAQDDHAEAFAALKRRLEAAAAAELERRSEKARTLISRTEYGKAVALFDTFPGYYGETQAAGEAAREVAAVKQRAHDDLAAVMAKAEQIVEGVAASPSAVNDADRLIAPFLEKAGLKEIVAAAKAGRRKIRNRADEIRAEIDEKRRAGRADQVNWQVSLSRIQTHLYLFGEASKTARYAQVMLQQLGDKQKAAELEERVKTIKQLEILFDLLVTRIERGEVPKNAVRLPYKGDARIAGVRRDTGEFILRLPEEDLEVPYGRLPPGEIARVLKGMKLYPNHRVALAEFCVEFGLVEQAREQLYYFDRVRGEKEQEHAEEVRGLVEEGRSDINDEKDAEALAKLAIEHAEAGRKEEAKKALQILRFRYGDTPSAVPATIMRIVKAMRAGRKAGD